MTFQTTVWHTIRAAGAGDRGAADAFVARYRPLLVDYLRLKGRTTDAEDLAQEVFLRVFSRDLLTRVDPSRGRFRSYLLAVTRNVLSEQRKAAGALKRGGGLKRVPLHEASATVTDPSFERCWCKDLLQRALDLLRAEHPRAFEVLELRLVEELPYEEIAARLAKPVEHVRVDVFRARKRMVKVIKEEIARYSASDEEAAEELEAFLRAL